MDYYQGVVTDYLRADRAVFVNTECCIQLNENDNPDKSGPHWYCDAVAVDFRKPAVFLCEISYASKAQALLERLTAWSVHWDGVRKALQRDCKIPANWPVYPWVFMPEEFLKVVKPKLESIIQSHGSEGFMIRTTPLEDVQPWHYCSWNRTDVPSDSEYIRARKANEFIA